MSLEPCRYTPECRGSLYVEYEYHPKSELRFCVKCHLCSRGEWHSRQWLMDKSAGRGLSFEDTYHIQKGRSSFLGRRREIRVLREAADVAERAA